MLLTSLTSFASVSASTGDARLEFFSKFMSPGQKCVRSARDGRDSRLSTYIIGNLITLTIGFIGNLIACYVD